MVVCKFFLQGNCRYGNNCRNEHPKEQPSQNRFAPLQNGGGGRGRSGAFGQDSSRQDQYGLTTEQIKNDLTHINADGDRPEWPLSAYAPGKNPPRQLIEGPLEISPEEMRVNCYLARAAGKPEEYVNQENQLLMQAQQQAESILKDLEAAKNYVLEGRDQHPNRNDMEIKPNQNFPWVNKPTLKPQQPQSQTGGFGQASSQPSAFGASANNTGGFGQPSSLGATKPAFGAPTAPGQGTAFGQSSALGGGSGFGQASQLGGGGGFGQPSKLGAGSGFGQASTLGANSSPFGGAQKPAAFGQTSQPAGGPAQSSQPAFGQSGFGQAAKPAFGAPAQPSGFGQAAQTSTSTPFGQPAQPSAFGQPSPFGAKAAASPFAAAAAAQNSQPQQQTSGAAFGQPSGFGANKPSPFAAAAQAQQQQDKPASPFAQQGATFGKSAFGTASQPGASSSPFAAANQKTTTGGFGAPAQPASQSPFAAAAAAKSSGGFGTASNNTPGGFGASNNTSGGFGTTSDNSTGGFGAPATTGGFGTAANKTTGGFGAAPQATSKTIPTVYNGHRVLTEGALTYYLVPDPTPKNPRGTKKVRIWFPTGPPEAKDSHYAEAENTEVYEGQLGETLKSLYEFVAMERAFKDGVMPEIPPKREWIAWDF